MAAESVHDVFWLSAGASGYVGSVVLEQLMRFAPDVARIYLLIRGKRGNTGRVCQPCFWRLV